MKSLYRLKNYLGKHFQRPKSPCMSAICNHSILQAYGSIYIFTGLFTNHPSLRISIFRSALLTQDNLK